MDKMKEWTSPMYLKTDRERDKELKQNLRGLQSFR